MLRSLYTAGTAMIAQSRRMDVIANNLTNVETRGYRADTLVNQSFRDMLISRMNDPNIRDYSTVGPHNTGIHIDRVYTDFTQGGLESTGLSTDFALADDGFFVIETANGPRYTRAGEFSVDGAGYLVTPLGNYVQGTGGRLQVGSTDFAVSPAGLVTNAAGNVVGQLRTVTFPDNGTLRKDKDNLFYNLDGAAGPVDTPVEIRQGMLENANVDSTREVVSMIEVQRSYEINQRILRMIDDSLGRTVNDIARV